MKKNDVFEIEITGMTDEGNGVGRADGMAVFVPYALVGETVKTVIIKVNKSYAVGKLTEVITPSESRRAPDCKHFYKCGGCQLHHTDYETELEYKRQKVKDCLLKIGGIDIEVPKTLGAESCLNYRNKGQFPVTPDGIGIYAQHSHRVIDMDKCLIQGEENETVIKCVREWMEKCGIMPYDEESGSGTVRHIYTRTGGGRLMVCIVTRTKNLPHSDFLIQNLKDRLPMISGIIQNINPDKTNVVLGNKFKTLWGEDFLIDTIGDVKFKISPLSFYQVNPTQTKVLYDKAIEFADLSGNEILWDMYCGAGTIGQYAAKKVKKVVGVEIVEAAIENAKENAKLNGIKNAEYYCGAAEAVSPKLLKSGLSPDVVILDPPRKGCDEKLLKTVADAKPSRIVYVSCKPSTLARDLKILETLGYKTEKVQPVDMFPRTSHVEAVALLQQLSLPDGK